jgi:hypothetical protein
MRRGGPNLAPLRSGLQVRHKHPTWCCVAFGENLHHPFPHALSSEAYCIRFSLPGFPFHSSHGFSDLGGSSYIVMQHGQDPNSLSQVVRRDISDDSSMGESESESDAPPPSQGEAVALCHSALVQPTKSCGSESPSLNPHRGVQHREALVKAVVYFL